MTQHAYLLGKSAKKRAGMSNKFACARVPIYYTACRVNKFVLIDQITTMIFMKLLPIRCAIALCLCVEAFDTHLSFRIVFTCIVCSNQQQTSNNNNNSNCFHLY